MPATGEDGSVADDMARRLDGLDIGCDSSSAMSRSKAVAEEWSQFE
jgi:hypothetical protein